MLSELEGDTVFQLKSAEFRSPALPRRALLRHHAAPERRRRCRPHRALVDSATAPARRRASTTTHRAGSWQCGRSSLLRRGGERGAVGLRAAMVAVLGPALLLAALGLEGGAVPAVYTDDLPPVLWFRRDGERVTVTLTIKKI